MECRLVTSRAPDHSLSDLEITESPQKVCNLFAAGLAEDYGRVAVAVDLVSLTYILRDLRLDDGGWIACIAGRGSYLLTRNFFSEVGGLANIDLLVLVVAGHFCSCSRSIISAHHGFAKV